MKFPSFHFSRNQYRLLIVILFGALLGSGIYSYKLYQEKREYDIFLQNQYSRAFRDLIMNVENIRTMVDKAEATGSTVQSATFMSSAWRQAFSASENLGQLPISHQALSKTAKYLTQIGDYCYAMSRQNAGNKLIDDKQMTQLKKLNGYSSNLLEELGKLEQDIADGKIRFTGMAGSAQKFLKRASENEIDVKFGKVEQRFSDYPSMIYDGPFSDIKIEGKPKADLGQPVSLEKAKEVAKKFIGGDKIGKIVEYSSGKGTVQTYGLELIPKDNDRNKSINIDITKNGGKVLWMLNPRDIKESKLTQEQADKKAKEFLAKNGFPNLTETYYLRYSNATMITYIAEENGILIYPDMIKVKVALDNGEIVGFDAYQYVITHRNRNIPKPSIAEEQAKEKVNKRLIIERVKLSIIPLPADREQLCYEFKAKNDTSDYFVYINAENGNEENVLKIINVENGTLTQ